jgi:26S proteasome regulatory subunit N11
MNAQLQRLLAGMGGRGQADPDAPLPDTSEQIYISSLALLKMLKHGRAGIPMEVVGLMLGEFVDDFTIRVTDVFSMPQKGNTVSIEDIDPVYQTTMLDMLKQTGRPEMVVGWYHSHPGFGCWFSGTDMNTQQSFEQLNSRAAGVVVDPIQSVKGKVVIDCFRLMNPQLVMSGQEPRQTTSNIGHLEKPSITALIHGLNRHYYSIAINYKKSELEQLMLLNMHKLKWQEGLKLRSFEQHAKNNATSVKNLVDFTKRYNQKVQDEMKLTQEEIIIQSAGKIDPKKGIEAESESLLSSNIIQSMGAMLQTIVA